jgi:hypothetical protein
MTFDEMQLILQQILISQREMQATQRETQIKLDEAAAVAQSNGKAIQAMLDRSETDRLRQEEEKAEHLARMTKYDEEIAELRFISRGLVNMFGSIDEDRPTILRKLNAIEDKTDAIINRLSLQ